MLGNLLSKKSVLKTKLYCMHLVWNTYRFADHFVSDECFPTDSPLIGFKLKQYAYKSRSRAQRPRTQSESESEYRKSQSSVLIMPRSESPSDDNSCDQVPVSNFTMSSPRSPQIAGFATLLPEYSGASDQGRPFFEAVESVARLANWDDDTTLIVVRSKFVGEAAHFLRESIDLRTGTNLQTFKAAVLSKIPTIFSADTKTAEIYVL
ncbi:hypothetical protein GQR58_009186 [Nymphon striatum]|nr:hypothetical protein GQR58_009186 [Nymphon striatum]